MKVYNEKYHFSFEIPDDFEEIAHEDYPRYHIDPTTLNIFIKYENDIPHTISLNRDDDVKDEKNYMDLVLLNLKNMEKMGMTVTDHIHQTLNSRRVDIVYSSFKRLKFVTYFTVVRQMMIACSVEIKEINDENDQILTKLFETIQEID